MPETVKCPVCGKDFDPEKIGYWEVEKSGHKFIFVLCPESDCVIGIK